MRVPGSNSTTCQLPSTTGVPTSTRPCRLLQGGQTQRVRMGVRSPAHNHKLPSVYHHRPAANGWRTKSRHAKPVGFPH